MSDVRHNIIDIKNNIDKYLINTPWRFIYKNQSFFKSNPRLSMMVRTLNKMNPEKLNYHLEVSEKFLLQLK